RIKGELILAQHAQFARAHHCALLRLQFASQDFHEGRLAGSVRPGQSVAPSRRESRAHVLEENLRAVAHGKIADADHGSLFPEWFAGCPASRSGASAAKARSSQVD